MERSRFASKAEQFSGPDPLSVSDLKSSVTKTKKSKKYNRKPEKALGTSMESLAKQNESLAYENFQLRNHLLMLKDNFGLRAANIIGYILQWLDSEYRNQDAVKRGLAEPRHLLIPGPRADLEYLRRELKASRSGRNTNFDSVADSVSSVLDWFDDYFKNREELLNQLDDPTKSNPAENNLATPSSVPRFVSPLDASTPIPNKRRDSKSNQPAAHEVSAYASRSTTSHQHTLHSMMAPPQFTDSSASNHNQIKNEFHSSKNSSNTYTSYFLPVKNSQSRSNNKTSFGSRPTSSNSATQPFSPSSRSGTGQRSGSSAIHSIENSRAGVEFTNSGRISKTPVISRDTTPYQMTKTNTSEEIEFSHTNYAGTIALADNEYRTKQRRPMGEKLVSQSYISSMTPYQKGYESFVRNLTPEVQYRRDQSYISNITPYGKDLRFDETKRNTDINRKITSPNYTPLDNLDTRSPTGYSVVEQTNISKNSEGTPGSIEMTRTMRKTERVASPYGTPDITRASTSSSLKRSTTSSLGRSDRSRYRTEQNSLALPSESYTVSKTSSTKRSRPISPQSHKFDNSIEISRSTKRIERAVSPGPRTLNDSLSISRVSDRPGSALSTRDLDNSYDVTRTTMRRKRSVSPGRLNPNDVEISRTTKRTERSVSPYGERSVETTNKTTRSANSSTTSLYRREETTSKPDPVRLSRSRSRGRDQGTDSFHMSHSTTRRERSTSPFGRDDTSYTTHKNVYVSPNVTTKTERTNRSTLRSPRSRDSALPLQGTKSQNYSSSSYTTRSVSNPDKVQTSTYRYNALDQDDNFREFDVTQSLSQSHGQGQLLSSTKSSSLRTPYRMTATTPSRSRSYTTSWSHSLSNKSPSRDLQESASLRIKPTTRLLGEIAYELDRQILHYVFKYDKSLLKKRLYGYLVRNIPEKIKQETYNPRTGLVDEEKRYILEYRYNHILNSLRPLGYTSDFHPEFCMEMVNRYGLLPLPSERDKHAGLMPEQKELLMGAVERLAPPEYVTDLRILVHCLALLAMDSGQAMIAL